MVAPLFNQDRLAPETTFFTTTLALASWKYEKESTRLWIIPQVIINLLRASVPHFFFGEGVGLGQELQTLACRGLEVT